MNPALVALGLRRGNLQRVYVTRGNGFSMEYGHLDLLLHPRDGQVVRLGNKKNEKQLVKVIGKAQKDRDKEKV